jgi:hypothetical protein
MNQSNDSDALIALHAENTVLKAKVAALQRRLALTVTEWKRLDRQVQSDLNADIICDFISMFYHHELTKFLKQRGFKYRSWSEVSTELSAEFYLGDNALKEECCKIAGFTIEEWDALFDYKHTRNLRVHPRRSTAVVAHILNEMPANSLLKRALEKMFGVLDLLD